MTVNEFVRRIQTKASMLSTGDIPIKFNGKDIECVIELIENGKGYYINIKQLTKELALTWGDVKAIVTIADSMLTHTAWDEIEWPDEQKYYEEVLRRFNEQRKK